MLRYVFDRHELVADFVAQMIPHLRGQHGIGKGCKAIGVVDDDNELIAGLIYHHWDPVAGTIEMTAAALPSCGWLTRSTLAVMYRYPFEQCNCQMVIKRVQVSNGSLLRQLAALGFRRVDVPRLFGRGRDGVICTLTYEDWRANKVLQRAGRCNERKAA